MKSDVTPVCARPRPRVVVTPGPPESPTEYRKPWPAETDGHDRQPRTTAVPEPPPDPALIPTPRHVLDAHLDYHRGRTAKPAREPWLPDEHQLGTWSVVCGLLVCIPFASGFAAVTMGLLALCCPSRRADGDQLLGAFGILVGSANFTYWLWGVVT